MRDKPLLHRQSGSTDPLLYDGDLDWYWGVFDSECGHRAFPLEAPIEIREFPKEPKELPPWGRVPWMAVRETKTPPSTVPSGDWTRGRRVWQALQRVPWSVRERLRTYYEPRTFFAPGVVPVDDIVIRQDHVTWYGAKRG